MSKTTRNTPAGDRGASADCSSFAIEQLKDIQSPLYRQDGWIYFSSKLEESTEGGRKITRDYFKRRATELNPNNSPLAGTPRVVAAIQHAKMTGYPGFPCFNNKRPVCPNGFKDAVSGANAIGELWRQYPGPLVGIPTGAVSGIDVLDVDEDGIKWHSANAHRLPETRINETRSGGRHLLFKTDPRVRCSVGKVAPGVDVRGEGGYIIWWPATGLNVKNWGMKPPPWPEWLIEAMVSKQVPISVRAMPRRNNDSIDNLPDFIETILGTEVGKRNDILFKVSCRTAEMVKGGKISVSGAAGLLLEAGLQSGLEERECIATVRSAFTTVKRHG